MTTDCANDTTAEPIRCICGWLLPAAFQIVAGDGNPPDVQAAGCTLLFACGNCRAWHPMPLTVRWAGVTATTIVPSQKK